MTLFTEFLSDQIIDALGWSLFHILWQGFAVAIILGLALRSLKNKSAQLRYIVSFISLLVFVGLSIYNFRINLKSELLNQEANIQFNPSERNNFSAGASNKTDIKLTSEQIIPTLKNKINTIDKYFPIVVNLWIFGVFIFTLKFILGYVYISRLRNLKTSSIRDHWLEKFKSIEHQLKIKQSINYIESRLIKIPMVFGLFKPVILIPTEMLTGMPYDQIEGIIAHEIAHIRRNDYIFNVVQTIIETMFFFHPAVWYISNQIRKERENCCDDLALTVCKESIVYAKALVSIQELTFKKHYAAVAFSGRKKHLLNRVKRMIMKPKVKSNFTDKIIAAMIILSGVLALSFTHSAKTYDYITESNLNNENIINVSNETAKNVRSLPLPIHKKDTAKIKIDEDHNHLEINDNKVSKTYKKDGEKHRMEFQIKNGKAYNLYVDGEKIAEKDYPKYQADIDRTIDDLEEAKEDIREAMKDIEEIDYEQIQKEVEEAIKNVHIDVAKVQEEIAIAMEKAEMINVEEVLREVEMSMEHLEDLDFDFDPDFNIELGDIDINMEEIKEEMERTREAIRENIDMEQLEEELKRAHEELAKIDQEKLRLEIEESLKSFNEFEKQEVMKELEEKLEELEKLELKEK